MFYLYSYDDTFFVECVEMRVTIQTVIMSMDWCIIKLQVAVTSCKLLTQLESI